MFACTNVIILASVDFLFVPPAPSSTMIKSEVVKAAPISVPPSISIETPPLLPLPSITTLPLPFGVSVRLMLVSSPVDAILGPLPVAAFVTSI